MSAARRVRWLAGLALPQRWWIAAAIAAGFATAGAGIGLTMTSAWLISCAALAPSIADLRVAIVGVRFFGLSRAVARYLERIVSHEATFRILARLRVTFYEAVEPQAPARLNRERSGDLLARIVADVESLDHVYARLIGPVAVGLLIAGLIAVAFGRADPRLAAAVLFFYIAAGLAVPLAVRIVGRRTGRELVRARAAYQARAVDLLQGMSDLLVFGRAEEHEAALDGLNREWARLQRRMSLLSGVHESLTLLLSHGAAVAVLALAIPQVAAGRMDGIMLAVYALGALACFEAVAPIPQAFQYAGQIAEASDRILSLVDAPPPVPPPMGTPMGTENNCSCSEGTGTMGTSEGTGTMGTGTMGTPMPMGTGTKESPMPMGTGTKESPMPMGTGTKESGTKEPGGASKGTGNESMGTENSSKNYPKGTDTHGIVGPMGTGTGDTKGAGAEGLAIGTGTGSMDGDGHIVGMAKGMDIHLDRVTFAYDPAEGPVLRDVTLSVPAGTKLALVGPSGAGKSTLTHLLLRFRDPDHGSIIFGGKDMRSSSTEELVRQIAVAGQSPWLFNGTLRDQMILARPRATDAEIAGAAARAQLSDWIGGLSSGWETQVGEQGLALSGGERRRVAVAQAFLRDAAIRVFDEPSADLDPETEARLMDSIWSAGDCTTIVITHRLTGLERADRVVVLDGGIIVADGTHAELLAGCPLYRRLHDLQRQTDAVG